MVLRKVWLIPVLAVVTATAGMLSGSIIGSLNGHLHAYVPFISDGGAYSPEACIFSQLLNISAFFIILTCYIRHRQTVEYYGHRLQWEGQSWRVCSLLFMWIGIISAISLTFVANFPETEVLTVHNIAAGVTFLSQIVYGWGQVVISFAMRPRMASTCVNFFRLFMMVVATMFLILHECFLYLQPDNGNSGGGNYVPYADKDGNFSLNHLIATSSEWAMVFCLQIFLLTFVAELRFAYAHVPRVVFCRSEPEIEFPSEPRHVKIVRIPGPADNNAADVSDSHW